MPARTNKKALSYFVGLLKDGRLEYRTGELWKLWEPRRSWLPSPKRAERKTKNGYWLIRSVVKDLGSLYVMSHRVIWSYFHGELLADELTINHLNADKGDNRIENLEAVSQKENNRHAKELGLTRHVSGPAHPRYCLSDADVLEIRRLVLEEGMLQKDVAPLFKVSRPQISRVVTGARRA